MTDKPPGGEQHAIVALADMHADLVKTLGLVLMFFGNVNTIGFDELVAKVGTSLANAGENPDDVANGIVAALEGPCGLGNIVDRLDGEVP